VLKLYDSLVYARNRAKRSLCLPHHDILLQRKSRSPSVDLRQGLRCAVTLVSWDQSFFDPIELPDCRERMALRDAATLPTRGRAIAYDEIRDGRGSCLPSPGGQGYRMFKSISTRKLSSHAARLSLPRNEVFVSG
jgi:hypothetical protein